MAKKSIMKNYLYNIVYQVLILILPLITTPYLSRVLGAEAIGIYGYTLSIVTYFVLFGTIGISIYGQREIAYVQNNKKKQSETFFEIEILKLITVTISLIIFYSIFCVRGNYIIYYRILIFELIASILDISWYFQGMEDFKKTVIRNIFVRIISLIAIFIFIKTQDDLWKYILIYTLSNVLGNISMWLYIPKMLEKVKIKNLNLFRHIKPAVALFIPQVATQIYVVLDKTMLGNITSNMEEVGFYEQAQKIVKVMMAVVTSIGTVMSSRIAFTFAEKKIEKIKDYLMKSFKIVWMIGLPMMFGIIAIASKLVPWFYGEGYEPVIPLIYVTAPIIVIIGLSNVTGMQYLIQVNKQKIYTISVVIGAILNIILNYFLINILGAIGAAISSVIVEIIILLIQLIYINNIIKIIDVIKYSLKYLISSIIMFAVVLSLSKFLTVSILNTLIESIIGAIIYFVVLILLKDKFLLELINNVLKKFGIVKGSEI